MKKYKKRKFLMPIALALIIAGMFLIVIPLYYTHFVLPKRESAVLAEFKEQKEIIIASEVKNDTYEEEPEEIGEITGEDAGDKKTEMFKYTAEDYFPSIISIPKINMSWEVNEGTSVEQLKKGPGHITNTSFPGQQGRCAISGHRTTYGAPFNRIDELVSGDLIYLETTGEGIFAYEVTGIEIVGPRDLYILKGTMKIELLLTTCTPKYTATKRLIIISELIEYYSPEY